MDFLKIKKYEFIIVIVILFHFNSVQNDLKRERYFVSQRIIFELHHKTPFLYDKYNIVLSDNLKIRQVKVF